VEAVDSVAALPRDLDAELETAAGAFLSLARLAELEGDSRYGTSYLVARDRQGVVALLPVYAPRVPRPSDPAYDLAARAKRSELATATADQLLLVGGRADLACGVPRRTSASPDETAAAVELLGHAARGLARESGRRPVAAYARGADAELLRRVVGEDARVPLGSHAHLPVGQPGERFYLDRLKSSHRSVVRRDWQAREAHGLVARMASWEEALEFATPMIGNVLASHGLPDEARLVRFRLERWLAHEALQHVAFRVDGPDGVPRAVSFGWVWRAWLQLYEVGLAPVGDPRRHPAYVEALIYAPLRYAARRGCSVVTLGMASEETKRLRGAVLEPVHALLGPRPPGRS
jgi:hypothetical protein